MGNLPKTIQEYGLYNEESSELPKGAQTLTPWGFSWGEYYGENIPVNKDAQAGNICNHEYVNVGFHHDKLVCKKCDKEKKDNE